MEASDQRLALHTLNTWDRAIDWRITREVAKGIGIILPSVAIQINITPEVIEARKSVASQIATWYDEWGEDNYFELPEMIEEEDLVEMARDLELPVPSTLGIGEIKRLRHQLRIRHIQQRTEDINNAGPEAEEESTPLHLRLFKANQCSSHTPEACLVIQILAAIEITMENQM